MTNELDDVRRQLSREMGDAGLTTLSVEWEVLRALPADFILQYELLWVRVFGGATGPKPNPDAMPVRSKRVVRTSSSQTETRGGAHGGCHTPANQRAVIRDDGALRTKAWFDRRLRALTRELRRRMGDIASDRSGVRRCSRCHRYAESDWVWCPWDGARTEEMN